MKMIDEPTPFDTLETWQMFLEQMRKLGDDPDAKAMAAKAEAIIAEKKKEA